MANKHGVFVYEHDCNDFRGTGLVGQIMPLEGTFTEEKNGVSEIVLKLPYDALERWKSLKVGNIIKAEVPVRVPPAIENDEYVGTIQVYNI